MQKVGSIMIKFRIIVILRSLLKPYYFGLGYLRLMTLTKHFAFPKINISTTLNKTIVYKNKLRIVRAYIF